MRHGRAYQNSLDFLILWKARTSSQSRVYSYWEPDPWDCSVLELGRHLWFPRPAPSSVSLWLWRLGHLVRVGWENGRRRGSGEHDIVRALNVMLRTQECVLGHWGAMEGFQGQDGMERFVL